MSWQGDWCYFKSYLNKEDCEEIIAQAKLLPTQDAVVGLGEDAHVAEYRKSKISFIQANDWRFSKLFDALWKTQMEANKDFFNIHVNRLDFVQFAEYDSAYEGEYVDHTDTFWMNDDPTHHRKISCVLQLSDPNDYEGGDLEITGAAQPPDPKEYRDQGSFVYFPSPLMHRANKVTAGKRYSIAAWFEGPKWT